MAIFNRVFNTPVHLSNHPALKDSGQTIEYADLVDIVKFTASRLISMGYRTADKILVLLPNCQEFVVSFFAISYFGGIVVLADTKLNEELIGIIDENNIKLIITNSECASKIERIKVQTGYDEIHVVDIENSELFSKEAGFNTNDIPKTGTIDIEADAPALILYTSGSTGKPKGVINTHRTLEAALENYQNTLPITYTDKLVAVTPFFHSYALGSCMLAGLASGATLLLQESFQPRKILKLITEERATIFHGVPYMYNLLNQQINSGEYSTNSIKFCISAGAPLSADVANNFYSLTCKTIHQEYGSSETGTIAISLDEDPDVNVKSVGKPLNGVEVKVERENEDDAGVIYIRSPGHSIGYVGSEPFTRDWYATGDLGMIDDHGRIHILGRTKRLINVAGLKVNPAELEKHLLKHKGIGDVLVRGAKHEDFGEIVEALIIRCDESITEEQIIKFCQQHFAAYKIPKRIIWVDSLPKSGTGKTLNI